MCTSWPPLPFPGRTCSRSDSSGPRQVPVYCAPVGARTAQVHYRWHAAFGTKVLVAYREYRRGETVAICELADGTRAILPLWMLDAEACATMKMGSPVVLLQALEALHRFLSDLGLDVRTSRALLGAKEVPDEYATSRSCTDPSAASRNDPRKARTEPKAGADLAACGTTPPRGVSGNRQTRNTLRGVR